MNSIIDSLFNEGFKHLETAFTHINGPAVNIIEHENDFHLEIAAPGRSKDDFTVTVEDRNLIVASENEKKEDNNQNYRLKEFGIKSFKRSFFIPKNADLEKIDASYENGVLLVVIPKLKEEDVSKRIEIK